MAPTEQPVEREARVAPSGRDWDYDAVVIGAGPGGSCAAAALAKKGRSVLVLERSPFPRFHIGESLLPMSGPIFEELGLGSELARQGFVAKEGASFFADDGSDHCRVDFTSLDGLPMPRSWHVERGRFDELLLDHAEACGAVVERATRATELELESHGVRIEIENDDGSRSVRAGIVLDASGRAGMIANKLGLRAPDRELKKAAVFAQFEGLELPASIPPGDITIVARGDLGWLWLIPLSETLTSVGAVFSADERSRSATRDPASFLDGLLASTPIVTSWMRSARRTGPVRFESDYSYACSAYAGERWLLVGDAGSFLDPVFSTGVQFALQAGMEAAEAVDRSLKRGSALSAAESRRFDRAQRRRYRYFRRLVTRFYRPSFRKLFFNTESWPGGFRSVATVLGGVDRPSPLDRVRVELFYLLGELHERLPFMSRPDRNAPEAATRPTLTP